MTALVVPVLVAAAALSALRVLRAGSLADRVAGFDVLLLTIVGLVAVDAVDRQSTEHLELPLIIGLLGFLGTITVATYLRRGGQR